MAGDKPGEAEEKAKEVQPEVKQGENPQKEAPEVATIPMEENTTNPGASGSSEEIPRNEDARMEPEEELQEAGAATK